MGINLLKNDRQTRCSTVHDGIDCAVEEEKDKDLGVSEHYQRVLEWLSWREFVGSFNVTMSIDGYRVGIDPSSRDASVSHDGT